MSNADARDIQITWYIPQYLRFGQISGALDGVQVIVDGDVVVFKVKMEKIMSFILFYHSSVPLVDVLLL